MHNWQKSFPILAVLAIATSPLLVGFSPFLSPSQRNANTQAISLKFPAAKDRGAPVTTSGGGARSGSTCMATQEGELSLNALTPNYSNIATTASANPALYFYIPPTKATSGELVITDENDNEIYETTFALPGQPGIVKLTVRPQTALVSGKHYNWSLMIICDSQDRYRDLSSEGKLEYQKLDDATLKSLETKDALEKAKFYANKGLWLDTLDNATQVRTKYPTDWAELLNSVGLEAMSNLPFVDCCAADNQP
jgi:hypothetical protein